jgi:hypothetical protein
MLGKNTFTKIFSFFVISWFFIGLSLQASQYCERVELDKRHPIHRYQFPESYIADDIVFYETSGYNNNQAKGIVGELKAQEIIEGRNWYVVDTFRWKEVRLVSLETYFENKGCKIRRFLRDSSNRGIDDIYVAIRDQKIDHFTPPIFHEAKFNSKCEIKLNETQHICRQLSREWITHHIDQIDSRIRVGNICFEDSDLQFQFKEGSSCSRRLIVEVEWLRRMFENKYFIRTASLLCKNGKFRFYNVIKSSPSHQ